MKRTAHNRDPMGHTKRRPLAGAALFVLFTAFLLLGLRYGHTVIRRLGLDPPLDPLPILMYHHVAEDGDVCNEMSVTVSRLREDFQYLADRGYTPVLPRGLLDPDTLPDKPVLLTFDDGYTSNYIYLFPLLREFGFHAVISPIVGMPDGLDREDGYCTWEMLREMSASGLVEIGSHTWSCHNLDNHGMTYPNGANGIQRQAGETDGEFQARVLDDIQKSYDRIWQEIGAPPTCFAYPFGAVDPDADALIDALFPVSLITWPDTADLADGTRRMPRWTVTMDAPPSRYVR
ncbi:MAG: polysaccharide deacetylase family protein [Oscillibacter sp.]|nr:polysaccharide deacetylase family protein [Oscillibacter sp.]